jgi:hypothetical protein
MRWKKRGRRKMEIDNALVARSGGLLAQARSLVLDSEENAGKAVDLIDTLRGFLKDAEGDRKKITTGINQSLKAINAKYKLLTNPVEEVMNGLRGKVLEWRQAKEAARVQEIEDDGIEVLGTVEVAKTFGGSSGKTAEVTKLWDYEVLDLAAVPRKYLVLDDRLVKAEIAAGVRDIQGLKIYQRGILRVG